MASEAEHLFLTFLFAIFWENLFYLPIYWLGHLTSCLVTCICNCHVDNQSSLGCPASNNFHPFHRLFLYSVDCFPGSSESFYHSRALLFHLLILYFEMMVFPSGNQDNTKSFTYSFFYHLQSSRSSVRLLIQWRWFFIQNEKQRSRFILLYMYIQFCQHYLLKRWSDHQCVFFAPLSKLSWL